jgi:2-haloacid dehalogenase
MWPHVISFDCYGTLVQWPETLRAGFRRLLPEGSDIATFHRTFTDIHARLRDAPYRPYTQLLQQALREAMTQWGVCPTPHASETLLAMVGSIPPYPDVPACLAALATQYRLAIISNTEDQLIAETVRGLGVPFEVITAAQAQAFKPDQRLFTYAFERLGCRASEVVHVGAGYLTDMVPAFALGMARIWINRHGALGDPRTPPSRALPDLTALPSCIASLAAGGSA